MNFPFAQAIASAACQDEHDTLSNERRKIGLFADSGRVLLPTGKLNRHIFYLAG